MDTYFWEQKFRNWASPPGKTEEEKCHNAEVSIRNAINANEKLKTKNIKVFTHGSYKNNTNVKKDSDVDVGVLCYDTFYYKKPEHLSESDLNIFPASYSYSEFKNDVELALKSYFGASTVSRGNKAFDLHGNSYHVEADITPFFEYRFYSDRTNYLSGVELISERNESIINWPDQHYSNGVEKNKATSFSYKQSVRIMKALLYELIDNNMVKNGVSGFMIECLLYNVPNRYFLHATSTEDIRSVLLHSYEMLQNSEIRQGLTEVNKIKPLIRPGDSTAHLDLILFLSSTSKYLGLI